MPQKRTLVEQPGPVNKRPHSAVASEEPLVCQQCQRSFGRASTLRRHIKTAHGSAETFICDYPGCDRSFNRNDSLQRHESAHDKLNFVTCNGCGRSMRNDYLKQHLERRADCAVSSAALNKPDDEQESARDGVAAESQRSSDESELFDLTGVGVQHNDADLSTDTNPSATTALAYSAYKALAETRLPQAILARKYDGRASDYVGTPEDMEVTFALMGIGKDVYENPNWKRWTANIRNKDPNWAYWDVESRPNVCSDKADLLPSRADAVRDGVEDLKLVSQSPPHIATLSATGPTSGSQALLHDPVFHQRDEEHTWQHASNHEQKASEWGRLRSRADQQSIFGASSVELKVMTRRSPMWEASPFLGRTCTLCGRGWKIERPNDILEHAKEHARNPEYRYQCSGCDIIFMFEGDLQRHLSREDECQTVSEQGSWATEALKRQFLADLRIWERFQLYSYLDLIRSHAERLRPWQPANGPGGEGSIASDPCCVAEAFSVSAHSLHSCPRDVRYNERLNVEALAKDFSLGGLEAIGELSLD